MLREKLNKGRWNVTYSVTSNSLFSVADCYNFFKDRYDVFNGGKFKSWKNVFAYLYDYAVITSDTYDKHSKDIISFTLSVDGHTVEPIKKNENGIFYIDLDVFYDAFNIKEIKPEEIELEVIDLI